MKLLSGSRHSSLEGSITTIGNFDGVHKGHQALLSSLRQEANKADLPLVVILFEPQPAEYFNNKGRQPRLQSLREKIISLKEQGVDIIYCLKFDQKLASLSAETFANCHIFQNLQTKLLMVGEDFRFGFQRKGDIFLLKQLCLENHCELKVFPDFTLDNQRISSTHIRNLLSAGDLKKAETLLGRPYFLCGPVVTGRGLGRLWGIPTANLKLGRKALPLKGVFCVSVRTAMGQHLQGVANLGLRPTLNGVTMVLEIHLFNFEGNLYGQHLQVFFLHKLRDEKKFPSTDELIHQIHQDISRSREWFHLTYNREDV